MKIALLTSALVFATLSSAHAFTLQASCQFDQAHGECQVYNNTGRPVYCQIQAQGMTARGSWANGFVNGWIAPGQEAYVNVYANNPYIDPLMNVSGSANCNF